MQLRIEENDFGTYNYEQYLMVNGVRKEFLREEFALIYEEESEEDELEISVHFENHFLKKGNKRMSMKCLIAIAELLLTDRQQSVISGDRGIGKPYDAQLVFTCKGTDQIHLHTNDITSKEPFTFYQKMPSVISNRFYTEKGAKKRWFLWSELGRCVLGVLLLTVFLLMFLAAELAGKIIIGLFLGFSLIFMSAYIVYLWKLLHRH